jgi:outer membrane protein
MKKWATVLAMAGLVAGGAASAADKPVIGVVDMNKIVMESKVGKRNGEQFQKLFEEKSEQVKKEEQKFDKMRQDFQKDQLVLSDKQKEEKRKDLQTKYEAVAKMKSDAEQELNKKRAEMMGKTVEDARAITAALAKELGLTLVLSYPDQNVLYAVDGVNLTAKVMERYDAKAK